MAIQTFVNASDKSIPLSINTKAEKAKKHQAKQLLMFIDSLSVRDLAQNFTEFVTVQDIFRGDLSFPIILDLLQLQRLY